MKKKQRMKPVKDLAFSLIPQGEEEDLVNMIKMSEKKNKLISRLDSNLALLNSG